MRPAPVPPAHTDVGLRGSGSRPRRQVARIVAHHPSVCVPRSNLLYGIIAEFCTEQACPVMCAGPKYEYMWADGTTIKKPISCSAPRYVDYLLTWVQNLLDDERIFPTEIGKPFPSDFMDHIRNIFKRLFRVYAHIYYCHFEKMGALGAEPHLNTCFKHYMYFVFEFDLIPNKQELAPLQELIDKLMADDKQRFGGASGAAAEGSAAAPPPADGAVAAPPSSDTPPPPQ